MRWLADLVYLLAGLAYTPVAFYNALFLGKNRRGWKQRFGTVPRFDPNRKRIWIHAVSLGEINCTPLLVDELHKRLPDYDIVVSTTTDTGYARGVQLFGAERTFRAPLDFSLVVFRSLKRIRPSIIILVELEVWYNLVHLATSRGIPVAVVNGRLTERSARRFRLLGRAGRSMFEKLAWVGAQDEPIAARFRAAGVRDSRVEITSSLKWDTAQVADTVDGAEELAESLGINRGRPLWVCGSTGPGEEALVLDAYDQLLRDWEGLAQSVQGRHAARVHDHGRPILALVPRKPERFDEVARLIERRGFQCVRRSEHMHGSTASPWPESGVVLGDTMGELRKFYSLADVVFLGRTLVPMGGSDPMEVAALGRPLVMGPHTDNFRLPVSALTEANAIRIAESADSLPDLIRSILEDGVLAKALGVRAREVVTRNQGATGRAAAGIVRVIDTAQC
ncbi:MAG: 3-deoxy-D-manno-octulosonic acid transferase [Phycisphaerales bacterium]|nr:MAG: 3-deoxy-D-manno-octulosonic acid transferase [Phycisphaerales bacterium]